MSSLKIGDKVLMNGNYRVPLEDKGVVFTVTSEPFKICGIMLVKLKNYSSGYAVDGLTKIDNIQR